MRLSYKQRLFFYFCVIFALFTVGIIIVGQSRERSFNTEAMKGKLNAYADAANVLLIRRDSDIKQLDSLMTLFPQNMRLTLIDKQGLVLYDNTMIETSLLENHAQRPEVVAARNKGTGTHIRVSISNNLEYLYYAKRYSNHFIRVALPYDIQVQHFLKADNAFLYYILALFVLMLLLINYVSDRFGNSIKQLRDFAGTDGNNAIKFPDDELGEVGAKIAANYRLLKESKQAIAVEREKLLQHVYSSEEGICFFSAAKSVEFHNGLFMQYLNTIVDESGATPLVVFTDPSFDKLNDFLSKLTEDDNYFETQITKQGKSFAVRVNIFEDSSFEVVLNDITKQEKTRLMKQEMTGNIAHELRTPVTSIRGYLETVLEQSPGKDKERSFLTKAYNQTLALSELIQDMGLITKIEEAPQSFNRDSVLIPDLLKSIKSDLEVPLQEKNITMEWNVAEDVIIKGNKSLLYSVFRNLTDNVIRHAGGNVKIFIHSYCEGNDFYFSYSDTGVGIANEQHLNRLFERFYRINEGRTRDTGGSGLGLSIVKNAILLHKGTIAVKNRIGGGLEFLFRLPKTVS